MLEVTGLGVSYGSTRAVDDFSFAVGAGEAVALLGANGAGKTSTLRALSRLIPSDGTVKFDGDDVTNLRPEELARRGLVHVPEGRHVFPTLTVNDNLLVGQTGRNGRRPLFTVAEIYDLFPRLLPLRKRYGWSLSGGEQQMVAIGRALLASPKLVMLDEPSLGLAPIVVRAVYQALAEVKSQLAVLLVEQNAALALNLCDNGHVLLSGRQVLAGSAEELGNREALMESYLGHAGESGTDEARPDGTVPTGDGAAGTARAADPVDQAGTGARPRASSASG